MVIERILAPVYALGPGPRIAIWVRGCSKKCQGCMSEELQSKNGNSVDEKDLAEVVIRLAKINGIKALTVSGGDPFEQAESLNVFLKMVRSHFNDILVYTGFTFDEIQAGIAGQSGLDCLRVIDVLIDGRYEEQNNDNDCVLRGSANQKIIFLNKAIESVYRDYLKKGRMIEPFIHNDETIIVGILNREEHE